MKNQKYYRLKVGICQDLKALMMNSGSFLLKHPHYRYISRIHCYACAQVLEDPHRSPDIHALIVHVPTDNFRHLHLIGAIFA